MDPTERRIDQSMERFLKNRFESVKLPLPATIVRRLTSAGPENQSSNANTEAHRDQSEGEERIELSLSQFRSNVFDEGQDLTETKGAKSLLEGDAGHDETIDSIQSDARSYQHVFTGLNWLKTHEWNLHRKNRSQDIDLGEGAWVSFLAIEDRVVPVLPLNKRHRFDGKSVR